MDPRQLRVIDFGRVSPLRSQTLWHAIAYGVSAGAPPTLSLMQPDSPYVSIGFHRRLEEVNREVCRQAGIPVFRRMVGGGPVYIDDGQVFFQITVPVADLPATRARAVRMLLGPAIEAFRAAGVEASLEDGGDIVEGDQKISGHGAGQIEQAVVVVGNLITRFDHAAAARIMATPDPETRTEFEALMRRYVKATPVQPEEFATAAAERYAAALGCEARAGSLSDLEWKALESLDSDFVDDAWLSGQSRPVPPVWLVKVKSGVFLAHASAGDTTVRVTMAFGRVIGARFSDPALNGDAQGLERSVLTRTVSEARHALGDAGQEGLSKLLGEIEAAARL